MTYKILVSKDKSGGQNAFGKVIKLCGSDSNDIEIFPDATPTLLDGITTYEELKKGYKGTTAFGDLESYTLEEAYLYLDKDQVVLGVGDGTGQKYVRGDYDSIKTLQEKLLKMETMHEHREVMEAIKVAVDKAVATTIISISNLIEVMSIKPPVGLSIGESNAYKTACISILSLIQAQDNEKTNKQKLQQIPGKTSHPEEDSGTSS